ncbi:MAG6090-like repeat-containing lipoprotein [Mycoplasmopsis agalactiae]|uniref:Lipoprotein n=1 Tax=Mycoplasmopsis agalactiae TaxID=2110 RepID=D3VRD5_MYCAA|nr:hypothetical protein [Mycoplasmopsis agalactiae]CBH40882.1 Hypothetical protein MAGa6790 [Mycoplasmopsis agalactiae]
MKKKWLLKGGLIALFSPLLSSACFVQNSDKPTDPANRVPVDGGTPSGGGNNGQPGNSTQPGNGDQSGGGTRPGDNSQARFVHSWDEIFNDSPTGADIFWHPSKDELEKEEKRLDDEVKKILDENKKINEKIFNEFIKSRIDSIFRDSPTGMDITLHPTKEELEKEEKRLADEVKKILDENKKISEKIFNEFVANGWYAIFRDDATGSEIGKVSIYDYETMSDKALNKLKAHFMKVKEFYDNIVSSSDKASESLRKQYEAYISNLKNELETNKKAIEKKIAENKSKLNYLEKEKIVKAKAELAETKESKKDILDLLEGAKEEKAYYESEAKIANEEVAKIKVFGDKIDALEKQIKESEAKIEKISSDVKKKDVFSQLLKSFYQSSYELKKQIEYLEDRIKDKNSNNFSEEFYFNNDVKFNYELISEWNKAIERDNEELTELQNEINMFLKDNAKAIEEINKLIDEANKEGHNKDNLASELEKLNEQVKALAKSSKDWRTYLNSKSKEAKKYNDNVATYDKDIEKLNAHMATGEKEEAAGTQVVKEAEEDLAQLKAEERQLEAELVKLLEKEKIISVLEKNKDKNNDSFDKNVFKYEIQSDKVADEIEKIEKVLEKRKQERIKKILTGVSEITKELFSDEFPNLVKEAVERYKKHGDKHASESAKMTAELFQDLYKKAVEEVKARIYRDSKSGLDINAYLTKEQIDKIVKDYLAENWRNNKAKFDEYLAAKETEEIFGNGYAKAIEEVKARIFRDSKSGLDIDIYLTDAEINKIVKEILEDNYWTNKAKFDEALASKETEEIFENGYAKAIEEVKAKYEKMIANLMAEKNKLNKEWKETEADLAKKEADLEIDKNKRIADINSNYEKNKHILEELKNKNNDELKKLLDANSNKDIKSELKSAKESLVDLNDLWWGAKVLADEYNLQKAELEEMIKKGNLVGNEIEKITELLEKVKTVSDMNEESIRKATAERKDEYERIYAEAIKEEKDLLSKLDEEDKLLLKVIQELTSWKWDSDQWYYSKREMDGFNHQHIARLKDAMWSNDKERKRINKLLADKVLEKEKDEKLDKLEEEIKAEIEKAKNEKQMLTKTLEKLNAEKTEIVKVISDHSRISKINDLSDLYNKNQKEIKAMIDKVSETEKDLSIKLSEFDSKFNKLQAEKEEINKWLAELEENNEAIITMEDDDYNSKVDNLDSEAYKLEKEKDIKEAELDTKINKFNKIISELNRK